MSVTVRLGSKVRHEVEALTVGEALEKFLEQRPDWRRRLLDEMAEERIPLSCSVNGGGECPLQQEAALEDGDELYIFPVASGGR